VKLSCCLVRTVALERDATNVASLRHLAAVLGGRKDGRLGRSLRLSGAGQDEQEGQQCGGKVLHGLLHLTIRMSHDEERAEGVPLEQQRDRAHRHWLHPLVRPARLLRISCLIDWRIRVDTSHACRKHFYHVAFEVDDAESVGGQ
jgi:hypothetical protein